MTDIKKRLNRLKKIPERLQEIKREVEYLESNPMPLNVFDKTPQGKSYRNTAEDRTIKTVDRVAELEEEWGACCREYVELVNAIEMLKDPMSILVLRFHYINGMTWKEIAKDLGESMATINKATDKAMIDLAELLSG